MAPLDSKGWSGILVSILITLKGLDHNLRSTSAEALDPYVPSDIERVALPPLRDPAIFCSLYRR